MQISQLEHRIYLQEPEDTNNHGEITREWLELGSVWAHIISEKGSEALEAGRTTARQTIRVAIRYRDDVTTACRIQWEGQAYEIIAVDRTAKRKGLLWFTARNIEAE